jgi:endonuclease/exonuclease/phosphatase family metal-dependent hydrolase
MPADTLRVLTQNLWGRRHDWPARQRVLAAAIEQLAPDIVALQEVERDGGYDQARDVLGDGYDIVHSVARGPTDDGIAIGSKLPVVDHTEIDLQLSPRTRSFAPATQIVTVEAEAPLGRVVFANHNPSWQLALEYEREVQAVRASDALERLGGGGPDDEPSVHVVVAGDFDAEPDAASVRFWTGRQSLDGRSVCYRDAWASAHPGSPPAETFTPANPLQVDWDWPPRAIDHILVRCGLHGGPTLAIRSCDVFLGEGVRGVWASDHFGLTADLVPPPPLEARV